MPQPALTHCPLDVQWYSGDDGHFCWRLSFWSVWHQAITSTKVDIVSMTLEEMTHLWDLNKDKNLLLGKQPCFLRPECVKGALNHPIGLSCHGTTEPWAAYLLNTGADPGKCYSQLSVIRTAQDGHTCCCSGNVPLYDKDWFSLMWTCQHSNEYIYYMFRF